MRKTLLSLFFGAYAAFSLNAQNLIVNGGFELPDDGVKYTNINDVPGWHSEDQTADHNGREPDVSMMGKYREYSVNTAGTFYQPIDVVTSDSAVYYVSYLSGIAWNDDAGKDTVYSVVYFSHYTPGSGMASRTLIDSIATDITAETWNSPVSVSFKLPAGVAYAGDSLIVEFATRVWDHNKVNTNTWVNMDNVVVTKNMQWSVFPIARVLDATNITGPNDFSAQVGMRWDMDSVYMIYSVKDDSITTTADPSIWNNDNIEIYFDMTNGKKAQWPRTSGWPPSYNNNGTRIPGNGYFQFRIVPDSAWTTYNGDAAATAHLGYTTVPGGYQFTVSIPWDTLYSGFVPAVGTKIGFDVDASDNDGNPDYRDQLSFNALTTNIYADAALWGTLEFNANGLFSTVPDTTAPTVPTNLAAKVVNDSAVVLTWDASSDNIVVQNYIIYQGSSAIDTVTALDTSNTYTTGQLAVGDYTFAVAAEDLYNNTSDQSNTVSASITAPVSSIEAAEFSVARVYPNPSNGLVTISAKNSDQIAFEVMDITGKQIVSGVFTKSCRLDLTNYGKGIYLIKMISGDTIETTRLVVK